MMRRYLIFTCFLLTVLSALPAAASHIVGGEMVYTCLGPAGSNHTRYRITLDIYQDCYGGLGDAISSDIPAYFSVFDGNNARILISGRIVDSVYEEFVQPVPPNFSNQCVNNIPAVCLRKVRFNYEYVLPNNSSGYRVVYQRCCRNAAVMNIVNPGLVGATYYCVIPPVAEGAPCNNSAAFKNYPPQIICINTPLIYDHSAVDPDADSLSYEFCRTYVGGETTNAKPLPPSSPPYTPVVYLGGFSAERPMAGNPMITIDPVTGMITGTPNLVGRFVVAVCCHEWRNGEIINTVTREFQFTVTNCSKAVTANIPQFSDLPNTYIVSCDGFDVNFRNLSTGGFSYHWDFDNRNPGVHTSSEFEPSFTYPDTGVYEVKLIVNQGSTCPDSITRLVRIYPHFSAGFISEGLPCPNSPILFRDRSEATYPPVTGLNWDFGNGVTGSGPDPQTSYPSGGEYTVTLIAQTEKGCVDTVRETLYIEPFLPFAGNDTIIVAGESIQFNASGGDSYRWSPSDFLSDSNIRNPVGYYPDTGRFYYRTDISTHTGCVGSDSMMVWVVSQPAAFVPSAFTPNGDGQNDLLKPIGIGYSRISYFRVYNRYGAEMFYTETFGEGWDGNINGSPAQTDTYFWMLKMTDRFGKDFFMKGDATLLR